MKLEELCTEAVEETDGLKACVLLDLDTGLPLASATRPGTDERTEDVAPAACRIFRGRIMAQFARAQCPGRELAGFVEEAHVTTAESQQFIAAVPGWDATVAVSWPTRPCAWAWAGWRSMRSPNVSR